MSEWPVFDEIRFTLHAMNEYAVAIVLCSSVAVAIGRVVNYVFLPQNFVLLWSGGFGILVHYFCPLNYLSPFTYTYCYWTSHWNWDLLLTFPFHFVSSLVLAYWVAHPNGWKKQSHSQDWSEKTFSPHTKFTFFLPWQISPVSTIL